MPKINLAKPDREKYSREEIAYLYSWMDPTVPARGPMMSEHPTVTFTLNSSTSITIGDPITGTGSWPTKTAVTMNDRTKGLVLACGPVFFVDKTAGSGNQSALYPGFVFDPEEPLDYRNSSGAAAGSTPLVPFGSYSADWPMDITFGTTDAFQVKEDGMTEASFRNIGLRATLQVTSNPLAASGQIYAGDSASYYPDFPAYNYKLARDGGAAGQITSEPVIEDHELYEQPILNGIRSARTVNAGLLSYGKMVESTFIPTNDAVLRYRSRFPTHCAATSSANRTVIGQPLLNGPFCLFYLEGLALGTVVTVSTSAAFEVPVKLHSSLGFLLTEARLARAYTVDWNILSSSMTGGPPGAALLSGLSSSAEVGAGLSMASGRLQRPTYKTTPLVGIAPVSSTNVVTNYSRAPGTSSPGTEPGTSLSQRLTDAAQTMDAGKQLVSSTRGVVNEAGGIAIALNDIWNVLSFTSGLSFLEDTIVPYFKGAEPYVKPALKAVEDVAPILMAAAAARQGKKKIRRKMKKMTAGGSKPSKKQYKQMAKMAKVFSGIG